MITHLSCKPDLCFVAKLLRHNYLDCWNMLRHVPRPQTLLNVWGSTKYWRATSVCAPLYKISICFCGSLTSHITNTRFVLSQCCKLSSLSPLVSQEVLAEGQGMGHPLSSVTGRKSKAMLILQSYDSINFEQPWIAFVVRNTNHLTFGGLPDLFSTEIEIDQVQLVNGGLAQLIANTRYRVLVLRVLVLVQTCFRSS